MTSIEHDLGPVGNFKEGKPYGMQVGRRAVLLVRRGDRFFALRDACPHAGAALSGGRLTGLACVDHPDAEGSYGRMGEIIACPWHGWEFVLETGRCVADPDRWRVRTYPVKVVADRVLLVLR